MLRAPHVTPMAPWCCERSGYAKHRFPYEARLTLASLDSSCPSHLGNDSPSAQNIWDFRPLVSVEFCRGQHEKTWASPNTLARVLARVLHAEAARVARSPLLACVLHKEKTRTARSPSARRKTTKRKNSSVKGSQGRCYNFR